MRQLTEFQAKRQHLAALMLNLFFLVADTLETIGTECEDINAECGYKMHKKESNHYIYAMKHIRALRSATRGLDSASQEAFGNDAEMLGDLLYAAISRTGTDNNKMIEFLRYIMQYPDRVGLDGVHRGGEVLQAIRRAQIEKRLDAYIKDNL